MNNNRTELIAYGLVAVYSAYQTMRRIQDEAYWFALITAAIFVYCVYFLIFKRRT